MVDTATPSDPRSADEPNTVVNVLVGAVVTIVGAPLLPFAAIVGGGVAGYLQRGTTSTGAKVGALSGLVAAIPAAIVGYLVLWVLLLGADPALAFTRLFAIVAFLVLLAYLVGAGALGGALGTYLREEF